MAATAQHAVLLLLLVGGGLQACAAKRLVAFGDSITDNGNGTNLVVQAFYSKLLGRPVTAVGYSTCMLACIAEAMPDSKATDLLCCVPIHRRTRLGLSSTTAAGPMAPHGQVRPSSS
jgi:hypothetical protein